MNDATITVDTLRLLVPEMILATMAAWIYVGGAFSSARVTWNGSALVALLLAGYALYVQNTLPAALAEPLSGPLVVDYFSQALRWVALAVGLLFVLLSQRAADDRLASEYLGSLLLVLTGLMLVSISGDLVLLFLGLELISIPTYILLFLGRADASSQEATTKYFFLSILSSAILLYGFSFLYGVAGSTRLVDIRAALAVADVAAGGLPSLLPVTLLLIVAGLGFKLAAVPFHFYAPDVYQGTSSANAALLSVAPKLAGVVALVRIVVVAMPHESAFAWQMLLVMSLVTMTLGNVLALWQDHIRRLLAYSSIAHSGYILIGLTAALAMPSAAGYNGVAAAMFYTTVYALATIGAFAALVYLGRDEQPIDRVDQLSGLARTRPLPAAAMAVFMFSLAGIPPLAGFWGKFALFTGAMGVNLSADGQAGSAGTWLLVLAVAGVVNAAIAAAYYLRIVAVMYFRPSKASPAAQGGAGAWTAMVVTAAMVVVVGVHPALLVGRANEAAGAVGAGAEVHGSGPGSILGRKT